MKKTVYHIMKNTKIEDIVNQSKSLFPFLGSDVVTTFASDAMKFKKFDAVINHKNIDQVLPVGTERVWADIYTFVFFGRSNVGKSSLLNALLHNTIAPMSKRPGKTKELLLCDLQTSDKAYFVDAPGYGYATGVSKSEIKQWGKMIKTYLQRTKSDKQRILCLVDITHGIKQTDALVFEMLGGMKKNFQVIFTKCDKLTEQDVKSGLEMAILLQNKYSLMDFYIHFTSSKSGVGIVELRNYLYFTIMGPKADAL